MNCFEYLLRKANIFFLLLFDISFKINEILYEYLERHGQTWNYLQNETKSKIGHLCDTLLASFFSASIFLRFSMQCNALIKNRIHRETWKTATETKRNEKLINETKKKPSGLQLNIILHFPSGFWCLFFISTFQFQKQSLRGFRWEFSWLRIVAFLFHF